MKKPVVFVTQKIHQEVEDFLESFSSPVFNRSKKDLSLMEKLRRARSADAILAFMPDKIDRNFLDQCRKLKIISTALKGYDNFDVSECTKRKIWFTISPDLLTIPTAELVIALMLGVTRNILHADAFVRSGKFKCWVPEFYGTGLTGKLFGIIGMGNVGKALAQRLHAFDLKLYYYDINRLSREDERKYNLTYKEFEDLLQSSDFIAPLVPYNKTTHYMINRENIHLMKKGSYLINCGRGSTVEESAVIISLENKTLAGYAADVYEMEEWARNDRPEKIPRKLLQSPKTLFTPHLGSAIDEIRLRIELIAVQQIKSAFDGNKPEFAINNFSD